MGFVNSKEKKWVKDLTYRKESAYKLFTKIQRDFLKLKIS